LACSLDFHDILSGGHIKRAKNSIERRFIGHS
jgi:hypothetical protein